MNRKKQDMGDMTSREIGKLLSKGLVNLGKEVLTDNYPQGEPDYGNLPSRTLSETGKQLPAGKTGKESGLE